MSCVWNLAQFIKFQLNQCLLAKHSDKNVTVNICLRKVFSCHVRRAGKYDLCSCLTDE